jgi:hypothetical protein
MDQIHLSPLVDQIQLTLGHISNIFNSSANGSARNRIVAVELDTI